MPKPGSKARLVLVTGGSGYVGSVLVPLVAKSYPVRVYCNFAFGNSLSNLPHIECIKGDIRDRDRLRAALEGVTDVIHLAAIVTDELVDMNPRFAEDINVSAMKSLCYLAKAAGVRRFIYASSSSVYGSLDHPATERDIPQPISAYARMKLAGEGIAEGYASREFNVWSIRSATACGPSPRMRLDTIVNVFCKQAWFDHKITVHGGSQYRSNIHVQDVASLYRLLLDRSLRPPYHRTFNLTSDNSRAIDIATTVAAHHYTSLGFPAQVHTDQLKQDHRSYQMSAAKLRRTLTWSPSYSIEDAIKDNFAWFANGSIPNPNDPIFYNTRRMEKMVHDGV